MDITQRRITKIAREVDRFAFRTLKGSGIGPGEAEVLHVIRKRPGITQKEICLYLGSDKGAVAREVASMEKKGLVVRRANPADGRSCLLYPTEEAEELKSSKKHIESLFYSWLLEDLTDGEKESFSSILEKLYLKCKEERRNDFRKMEKIVKENAEYES